MNHSMAVLAVLVLVCAALSPAQAQKALYLGAGIGNSFIDAKLEDASSITYTLDEKALAWKIFAGYQLAPFLTVEGGYRNLGKISTTTGTVALESKTTGWDVSGVGIVTIAFVDLFGKAGAFFYRTDAKVGTADDNAKGTAFLWGLGAGVRFGMLGARLEWESLEVESPSKLSVIGATVTLGF